ncbi:hypothetical protein A946_03940 [Methylacidiphilum kamchatkense Kam1]|uniref:Uncharacterized protein n=1 Tax=Methylacidiphilum kamchatkense Kam1 TaxID=1202785 RepID=A0ABR4ZY37_9BACT|nr:hypothetical protein A946_03940 [Methylacidiphilum kamchatkense Kam1]
MYLAKSFVERVSSSCLKHEPRRSSWNLYKGLLAVKRWSKNLESKGKKDQEKDYGKVLVGLEN